MSQPLPTSASDSTPANTQTTSQASAPQEAATDRTQNDGTRSLAAIKADYLYQFLRYVEFPKSVLPQPDSPLVIGVMGADDVFNALADVLAMRTINNRAVLRRRLSDGDSLAGVHLLFIGKKIDLSQNSLAKAARNCPILLVSETQGGLNDGAIFNFLAGGEHLRFEASLEAADRASLKISSRVLTLAERVIGGR